MDEEQSCVAFNLLKALRMTKSDIKEVMSSIVKFSYTDVFANTKVIIDLKCGLTLLCPRLVFIVPNRVHYVDQCSCDN